MEKKFVIVSLKGKPLTYKDIIKMREELKKSGEMVNDIFLPCLSPNSVSLLLNETFPKKRPWRIA